MGRVAAAIVMALAFLVTPGGVAAQALVGEEKLAELLHESQRLLDAGDLVAARALIDQLQFAVVSEAPNTELHAQILMIEAQLDFGNFRGVQAKLQKALDIEEGRGAGPLDRARVLLRLAQAFNWTGMGRDGAGDLARAADYGRSALSLAKDNGGDQKMLLEAMQTLQLTLSVLKDPAAEDLETQIRQIDDEGHKWTPEVHTQFARLRSLDGPQDAKAAPDIWRRIIALQAEVTPGSEQVRIALLEGASAFAAAGLPGEAAWARAEGARLLAEQMLQRLEASGELSSQDRHEIGEALATFAAALRDSDDDLQDAKVVDQVLALIQLSRAAESAAAVNQAGRRLLATDTALAGLLKQERELAARSLELERDLLAAAAAGDLTTASRLRSQRAASLVELSGSRAKIRAAAPNIAAFGAWPVTVAETQAVLRPGEALVAYNYSRRGEGGLAVIVVQDRAALRALPAISGKASTDFLRAADLVARQPAAYLDRKFEKLGLAPEGDPFDYELMHRLHQALISPLIADLSKADVLIIAPDRTLAAVPFALLVSQPPVGAGAEPERAMAARWLGDQYALVTTPSVGALVSVRGRTASPGPMRSILALSNPRLKPREVQGGVVANTLASFQEMGGGALDVCAMSELAQTPLMAAAVTRNFAKEDVLSLSGEGASEQAFRALADEGRLGGFDVIAFNTHALTAGRPGGEGLGEPALVLTPPWSCNTQGGSPEIRIADNDGLLTASEIARLDITAKWVLLTACDTAAALNADSEPLSGLAASFFYAGARALFVSSWAADEAAAERLLDTMFDDEMQAETSLAKRLKHAQAKMRQDPAFAQPAFWAVFSVIGDG